jgi:hypothetical protein
MNILATSASPQTCARNLDNYRLEQQVVTVSLLLSAYAKTTCYPINELYRFVPEQHPFLRWVLNDEKNIDWLKDYGVMLLAEYVIRFDKQHVGSSHIYNFIKDFQPAIGLDPDGFLNRAWDETFDFRYKADVHQAYRDYLNALWTIDKKRLSWGTRMPPAWYIEEQIKRAGKDVDKEMEKLYDRTKAARATA